LAGATLDAVFATTFGSALADPFEATFTGDLVASATFALGAFAVADFVVADFPAALVFTTGVSLALGFFEAVFGFTDSALTSALAVTAFLLGCLVADGNGFEGALGSDFVFVVLTAGVMMLLSGLMFSSFCCLDLLVSG
jgi:hypothetical protein